MEFRLSWLKALRVWGKRLVRIWSSGTLARYKERFAERTGVLPPPQRFAADAGLLQTAPQIPWSPDNANRRRLRPPLLDDHSKPQAWTARISRASARVKQFRAGQTQ